MISGVYSSIFIATPLLAYLKTRSMPPSRRKRLAGDELRAAVMGAGVTGRIPEDTPHRDDASSGDRPLEPVGAGAATTAAPAQADRLLSHPPRPRKKKRR
jgi:preprotein translocase subunit SecF